MNRKVRLLAFKSALSLKLMEHNLFGLEANTKLEVPSTKKIVNFISNANLVDKKILLFLMKIMKIFLNQQTIYLRLFQKMKPSISS